MVDIDRADIKQIIWQKKRDDLVSLVPWFKENNLILCPTCCRPLKFEDLSLEHIIPRQALSDDPLEVAAELTRNERSGLTLLCRKPLYIKGEKVYPNGCNSWKGKYFDTFLRKSLQTGFTKDFNQRHHIALLSAGYLALFRQFGYQIVLTSCGRLLREQFFSPNKWRSNMPVRAQIAVAGEVIRDYDESQRSYWSEPFSFTMHDGMMSIGLRNMSFLVPVSHDPNLPLARLLPYTPPRFRLRPDLTSIFD